MLSFLTKYKIISDKQNGYIPGRSTFRAAYQLLEEIINGVNDKKSVCSIFVDLSKAFDSVHHPTLLHKMERMGFRDTVLKWFESYLSGRKQSVVVCQW